jgi:hypothetical protein
MKGIVFKINRPVYDMDKIVNSAQLKVGDRFMYEGSETLVFKTNHKSQDGKYLCCNETGVMFWIDGESKVKRLNAVRDELVYLSKEYIKYFNNQNDK